MSYLKRKTVAVSLLFLSVPVFLQALTPPPAQFPHTVLITPSSEDTRNAAFYGTQDALIVGAVLSAIAYGGYKLTRSVFKPENRVWRTVENGKNKSLETLSYLMSVGISSKNIQNINENISVIASNQNIEDIVLTLQNHLNALEISLLQIDYCLEYIPSVDKTELEAIKGELIRLKTTLHDIILPALKKHLHGVTVQSKYSVRSYINNKIHTYISKPFYPLF